MVVLCAGLQPSLSLSLPPPPLMGEEFDTLAADGLAKI
jgi:hypothetical protein